MKEGRNLSGNHKLLVTQTGEQTRTPGKVSMGLLFISAVLPLLGRAKE